MTKRQQAEYALAAEEGGKKVNPSATAQSYNEIITSEYCH